MTRTLRPSARQIRHEFDRGIVQSRHIPLASDSSLAGLGLSVSQKGHRSPDIKAAVESQERSISELKKRTVHQERILSDLEETFHAVRVGLFTHYREREELSDLLSIMRSALSNESMPNFKNLLEPLLTGQAQRILFLQRDSDEGERAEKTLQRIFLQLQAEERCTDAQLDSIDSGRLRKIPSACGIIESGKARLFKQLSENDQEGHLPSPDESAELGDKTINFAQGIFSAAAHWLRTRRREKALVLKIFRDNGNASSYATPLVPSLTVIEKFRAFFIHKGCLSPLDVFALLDVKKAGRLNRSDLSSSLSQLRYPQHEISEVVSLLTVTGSLRLMDLVAIIGPSLDKRRTVTRKLVQDKELTDRTHLKAKQLNIKGVAA